MGNIKKSKNRTNCEHKPSTCSEKGEKESSFKKGTHSEQSKSLQRMSLVEEPIGEAECLSGGVCGKDKARDLALKRLT